MIEMGPSGSQRAHSVVNRSQSLRPLTVFLFYIQSDVIDFPRYFHQGRALKFIEALAEKFPINSRTYIFFMV
jgi:hypothetical protein